MRSMPRHFAAVMLLGLVALSGVRAAEPAEVAGDGREGQAPIVELAVPVENAAEQARAAESIVQDAEEVPLEAPSDVDLSAPPIITRVGFSKKRQAGNPVEALRPNGCRFVNRNAYPDTFHFPDAFGNIGLKFNGRTRCLSDWFPN